MLVLNRGHREVIMIGDDISIEVLDIQEDIVKIGIHAPNHKVYRYEIYKRIQKEKQKVIQTDITEIRKSPQKSNAVLTWFGIAYSPKKSQNTWSWVKSLVRKS
ncbi:MAG: hypothetical protein EOM23_06460 [Candidatus Moranbacteria bacterium]|nr:hypothetical protein [Candidatus Moranbacteria bacterium]